MSLWRAGGHAAPARAVAAFFFILGVGFANWVPRLPEVQSALGLGHGELGLALLGLPVGSVVSMPLAGLAVERWGAARTARIGMVAFCVLMLGPALAWSYPGLIAGMVLLGIGMGGYDVAINAEAAAVERRHGTPVMSACHGLFSVGGMVGAGMGGLMAEWHLPLIVHLGVVGLLLLVIGLAAGRHFDPHEPAARSGPLLRLPTRELLGLCLLALFAFFCEGVVMDWSTVFLANVLGASPLVAGLGFSAFSLAMAVGRLLGDRIVMRFGPLATVRGGELLGALGMVLVVGTGSVAAALIGLFLIGCGLATIVPILVRSAGQRPGLQPGPSIAAVVTAGYTGLLAGPPVIGLAAEAAGLPAAFTLMIVLALLVALLAGPFGVERRLTLAWSAEGVPAPPLTN